MSFNRKKNFFPSIINNFFFPFLLNDVFPRFEPENGGGVGEPCGGLPLQPLPRLAGRQAHPEDHASLQQGDLILNFF
jgi:hypothetical protein